VSDAPESGWWAAVGELGASAITVFGSILAIAIALWRREPSQPITLEHSDPELVNHLSTSETHILEDAMLIIKARDQKISELEAHITKLTEELEVERRTIRMMSYPRIGEDGE
jgi:hypothetical protein